MTQYTCFAFDQIFVTLEGKVSACCMAQEPLGTATDDFSQVLRLKMQCNTGILLRNDATKCWADCPSRLKTPAGPDPKNVRKVVFYTNTYCPLQCRYCSLTYAVDAPDWENDESLSDRGHSLRPDPKNGVWSHLKSGSFVAPVHTTANDNPKFLELVERMFPIAKEKNLWFEFSGGDSAYHPEFEAVLERCIEAGINVSYLSSGVVPAKIERLVERGVAAGLVWPTISLDSTSAATWATIKRRPERLFERILDFVKRCTAVEIHAQVGIKYIVMPDNLEDLPKFVPFYRDLGVKKFILSSCRAQPINFIRPVIEPQLRGALAATLESWSTHPLPPQAELILIGFEEFSPQTLFRPQTPIAELIHQIDPARAPRRAAVPPAPQVEVPPVVKAGQLPLQAVADHGRAQMAYASNQFLTALDATVHALTYAPNSVLLRSYLGNIHFKLGDFVSALDAFQKAADLEPGNIDLLVQLADMALRCDKVELFEMSLGRALELDPKNLKARRIMADANLRAKCFADAAEQYKNLQQQFPSDLELLTLEGVCHYRMNDTDSAIRCFEQVLTQDPHNAIASENLHAIRKKIASS